MQEKQLEIDSFRERNPRERENSVVERESEREREWWKNISISE